MNPAAPVRARRAVIAESAAPMSASAANETANERSQAAVANTEVPAVRSHQTGIRVSEGLLERERIRPPDMHESAYQNTVLCVFVWS